MSDAGHLAVPFDGTRHKAMSVEAGFRGQEAEEEEEVVVAAAAAAVVFQPPLPSWLLLLLLLLLLLQHGRLICCQNPRPDQHPFQDGP